jgi:hypothetical protein
VQDTWEYRNALTMLDHVQEGGQLAYCNGCNTKVYLYTSGKLNQHTEKERGAENKGVNCGKHTIPLSPVQQAAHVVTLRAAVDAYEAADAAKKAADAAQALVDKAAKAVAKEAAKAAKKAAKEAAKKAAKKIK